MRDFWKPMPVSGKLIRELLLLFLLFGVQQSFAQRITRQYIMVECMQNTPTKMIGRIVDVHHRPIDFANVALLNVRDSSLINGGVTNENGQFVIPCDARKAIVRVSCVGYITTSNTYNIGKIGTITLMEATMNL